MSIFEYCQKNTWVDIKSEDHIWRMAKIIQVHSDHLEIEYDAWGSGTFKVPFNSKRISPFRTHTSLYTGRPESRKENFFSLSEISSQTAKLETLLEKPFVSLTPFELIQFLRGDFSFFIENFIELDCQGHEEIMIQVIRFLEKSLEIISKFFQEFSKVFANFQLLMQNPKKFMNDSNFALASCLDDVADCLEKVLGLSSRCRKLLGKREKDAETLNGFEMVMKNDEFSSVFFHLLEYFLKIEGFSVMNKVLDEDNDGLWPPVQYFKCLCLQSFKRFINPLIFADLRMEMLKGLQKRVKVLNDKDFKFLDLDVLKKLMIDDESKDKQIFEGLLELYVKMVKCPYLEKRIKGLNEITGMVNSNQIENEKIAAFLKFHKIIEEILQVRPHEELIKRSAKILKLMSKFHHLEKNHCKVIINFMKNGNLKDIEVGFKILNEIAKHIDETLQLFIYDHLLLFPPDHQNLQLLTNFTLKSRNFSILIKIENFLLKNMEDGSNFPFFKQCIKSLENLYTSPEAASLSSCYLESLPSKFSSLLSIPQHIQVSLSMLKRLSKSELQDFCTSWKLKRLIINNVMLYMKSDTPGLNFCHKDQLAFRFKLLEFISVKTEYNVALRTSEISKLWEIFVRSSKSDFQAFLTHLSVGTFKGPLVQDCSKIFNNFFLDSKKFNISACSVREFTAFKKFFIKSNLGKSLKMTENGKFSCVVHEKILGIEKIFEAFLESSDEVYEKVKKVLFRIFRVFEEEDDAERIFFKNFEKFIEKVDVEDKHSVQRALQFFYLLLDLPHQALEDSKYYILVEGERKKVYLSHRPTVRVIRKKISETLEIPLNLVAFKIDQTLFNHLNDFQMLKLKKAKRIEYVLEESNLFEIDSAQMMAKSEKLLHLVFEILMKNQQFLDITWEFAKHLKVGQQFTLNLKNLNENLEFPEDPHMFLHTLTEVLRYSNDQDWLSALNSSPIQEKILNHIINCKKNPENHLSSNQEALIIQILTYLTLPKTHSENILKILLKSLENLLNTLDSSETVRKVLENSEKIIKTYETCHFESLKKVLNSELSSFFSRITEKLVQSTCSRSNFRVLESFLISLLKNSSETREIFEHFFNEKVLSEMNDLKSCRNYLSLLKTLVKTSEIQEKHLKSLHHYFQIALCKLTEGEEYDERLDFSLKLEKAVLKKFPEILPPSNSILLTHFCSLLAGKNEDPSQVQCKSLKSRLSAVRYTLQLIQSNPSSSQDLELFLLNIFQEIPWRSLKSWNLSFCSKFKHVPFLGLKNLSNTCYMNSLFQQLFFIIPFRSTILRQDCSLTSSIFQVKHLFTKLSYLNSPSTSPRAFCRNFYDFEGRPVNIREQMDVDEFFCRLLDRIEEDLKGSLEEDLIKDTFCLSSYVEMLSECSHVSQREEMMISIPIEVRNKTSLTEGLLALTQGEMMRGENSYFCGECGKKVSSCRRTSFKSLPNVLVFALRRFEFNYDLMQRNKLNDWFQFDDKLDMKQFTTESLNRKNLANDDYYLFQLTGIIMHYGKAEQGHYYSYVKVNEKWIEFNDSHVSFVDVQVVKDRAFGSKTGNEGSHSAYLLVYQREKFYKFKEKENFSIIQRNDNLDLPYVKMKNKGIWVKRLIVSQEFLIFMVKGIKKKLFSLILVVEYFFTTLIRVEKCFYEKFQVFSFLFRNLDEYTAQAVLGLTCTEQGMLEFILTCTVSVSRLLVCKLIQKSIGLVKPDGLLMYFEILVSFFKNLKRFSYTAQYFEVLLEFSLALPEYAEKMMVSEEVARYLLDLDSRMPESPSKDCPRRPRYPVNPSTDQYPSNKSSALSFLQSFTCKSLTPLNIPSLSPTLKTFTLNSNQDLLERLIQQLSTKSSQFTLSKFFQTFLKTDRKSSLLFIQFLLKDILQKSNELKMKNLFILTHFLNNHNYQKEILMEILPFLFDLMPVTDAGEFVYFIEFLMKIVYCEERGEAWDVVDLEKIQQMMQIVLEFMDQGYEGLEHALSMLQKFPRIDAEDVVLEKGIFSVQPFDGCQVFVVDGKKMKKVRAVIEKIEANHVALVKMNLNGREEIMIKSLLYDEIEMVG